MINAYELINSTDIRNYLKSIDYEFKKLQILWLIYNNATLSIREKHDMYNEFINFYTDCVIDNNNGDFEKPFFLHSLLKKYIYMENKRIREYYKPFNNCEYICEISYKSDLTPYNKPYSETVGIYSSIEECINNIRKRRNFDIYKIRISIHMKDIDEEWYLWFNEKFDLIKYSGDSIFCNHEDSWILDFFENIYINFPIPFKEGDILYNCIDEYYHDPFIFIALNKHAYDNYSNSAYMDAIGYFYNYKTGKIRLDQTDSYMNLAYVSDTNKLPFLEPHQ